ncbi:hypothetical protein HOY82DRAFT_558001 [Tuber indicum]|nr:hypothetical protein HOY82DRAFT_558001 [Tuber indicum]
MLNPPLPDWLDHHRDSCNSNPSSAKQQWLFAQPPPPSQHFQSLLKVCVCMCSLLVTQFFMSGYTHVMVTVPYFQFLKQHSTVSPYRTLRTGIFLQRRRGRRLRQLGKSQLHRVSPPLPPSPAKSGERGEVRGKEFPFFFFPAFYFVLFF